jgi:dolichol-phosphate mannosyltransferase
MTVKPKFVATQMMVEDALDTEPLDHFAHTEPHPGAAGWVAPEGALELAVIIPTFNESGNLRELLRRLDVCLEGIRWEAVVVDDDSPDGTADLARQLSLADPRVRCIRRVGRRGLASACVEGMMASAAPVLAVIDADLQHDENLLPRMLKSLREQKADLVVGTRYTEGGGVSDWDGTRQRISRFSTWLSQKVLRAKLSDPMSGFFMLRREVLEGSVYGLSNIGFKILLDIVVSSPVPLKVVELPYEFRSRVAGESKLDGRVAWEFLMLLVDKTVGRWVPVRLVSFSLIGGSGVLVHMAMLGIMGSLLGLSFTAASMVAVFTAMVSNFFLNNALTYRDQQLRGWRVLWGLLQFMAACSIGAAANVGVARHLFNSDGGWVLSALAGILVGTLWNYAATAYYVWVRR